MANGSAARPPRMPGNPLFIDLGKQKKKRIQKLRTCDGKLMVRISDALESMIQQGQLKSDLQTVVVIVEQRRRKRRWAGF